MFWKDYLLIYFHYHIGLHDRNIQENVGVHAEEETIGVRDVIRRRYQEGSAR